MADGKIKFWQACCIFVCGCLLGGLVRVSVRKTPVDAAALRGMAERMQQPEGQVGDLPVIEVLSSGRVVCDGRELDGETEDAALLRFVAERAYEAEPGQRQTAFLVKADCEAPFGRVEAVFQRLEKLGVKGVKERKNFVLAGESRIPEENIGLSSGTGTIDWGGKEDGSIPLVWPGTPEWEFLARAYPLSPEKACERAQAFDWEVCHAEHLIVEPALLMGDWYFLPAALIAGDVAMIGWLVNGRTGDVRVVGDVDDAWNVFPRFLLSKILPREQADRVPEQALYELLGMEVGTPSP